MRKYALYDVRPLHGVNRSRNAKALGIGDDLGDFRSVYEHLGRNAPYVEAGTTKFPFFHDGNGFIVKFGTWDGIT